MRRTLILTPYPFQEAARWAGRPVITPNTRAAETLGAAPQTLESLAHGLLTEAGLAVASPLAAHAMLRQSVEAALAPTTSSTPPRSWSKTPWSARWSWAARERTKPGWRASC